MKMTVEQLNSTMSWRHRWFTTITNWVFRILKPHNLECLYVQIPAHIPRDIFLPDLMTRMATPMIARQPQQQAEEMPCCCVAHTLMYIKEKNHCPLPDNKMQQFYDICVKEEEYELAEIILTEANRRLLKLSK